MNNPSFLDSIKHFIVAKDEDLSGFPTRIVLYPKTEYRPIKMLYNKYYPSLETDRLYQVYRNLEERKLINDEIVTSPSGFATIAFFSKIIIQNYAFVVVTNNIHSEQLQCLEYLAKNKIPELIFYICKYENEIIPQRIKEIFELIKTKNEKAIFEYRQEVVIKANSIIKNLVLSEFSDYYRRFKYGDPNATPATDWDES